MSTRPELRVEQLLGPSEIVWLLLKLLLKELLLAGPNESV